MTFVFGEPPRWSAGGDGWTIEKALVLVDAHGLEFEGTKTLPEWLPQDCRVCLETRHRDRDVRFPDYHMVAGTEVVALRDGYYAHAGHTAEAMAAYRAMLGERIFRGGRI